MKTKILLCGVVFLVVSVGVCCFAAEVKKYSFFIPNPYGERYGTWFNETYSGKSMWAQKLINYQWGAHKWFMTPEDKMGSGDGTAILTEKWKDSEGNIWYKAFVREDWTNQGMFTLEKISKNGSVLEIVWGRDDFPKKADLNPNNPDYRIYYRQ